MLTKNNYPTVIKPWGKYVILEKNTKYWIKKLFINRGESLSLQSHRNRSENWLVLTGHIEVIKDKQKYTLNEGDYLAISRGEKHRITGLTKACVLEVAFGLLQENDIIRYQDNYGRE